MDNDLISLKEQMIQLCFSQMQIISKAKKLQLAQTIDIAPALLNFFGIKNIGGF